MPSCFVIMPYGGSDEKQRKHFLGVYQSIILPALTRAGYTVKRSDMGGEPGNITQDIIRDLAEADVVIADLTGANANVFFELGIRHVLRKSGTVHIVDRNDDIPFDIRQYRAVQYTTELADLPSVIDEIVAAINKRMVQPNRSDNPVHDAIPSLPSDVRSTGDEALRNQLSQIQEVVGTLQSEKEELQRKLSEIDPSGTLQMDSNDIDIDKILNQADEAMRSAGEHVLLRLKNSIETGGSDAFVDELRTVLKSPYLSLNDIVEISNMCTRLGLAEHRRATLEVARQRYPTNDEIIIAQLGAYKDSPNAATRERGRLMIEQYLSVVHEKGSPKLSRKPRGKVSDAMALLLDSYFDSHRPDWVLSVAQSFEEVLGANSMIVRNKARALSELGQEPEAEAEFKRAILLDPTDQVAHAFYANFLDDAERFEESYVEHEEAILALPETGTAWLNLAIQILNRGLTRTASGTIIGPIPKKARLKFTVPLLIRSLEVDSFIPSRIQSVVGILVRADAMVEAQAIANGVLPDGSYDDAALRYIDSKLQIGTTTNDI